MGGRRRRTRGPRLRLRRRCCGLRRSRRSLAPCCAEPEASPPPSRRRLLAEPLHQARRTGSSSGPWSCPLVARSACRHGTVRLIRSGLACLLGPVPGAAPRTSSVGAARRPCSARAPARACFARATRTGPYRARAAQSAARRRHGRWRLGRAQPMGTGRRERRPGQRRRGRRGARWSRRQRGARGAGQGRRPTGESREWWDRGSSLRAWGVGGVGVGLGRRGVGLHHGWGVKGPCVATGASKILKTQCPKSI